MMIFGRNANVRTLPATSTAALLSQSMLLAAAAIVLPAAMHLSGMPVHVLIPMHWPVLLAGLVYGWRGGLLVGMLTPYISFLTSGMPSGIWLTTMTAELFAAGAVAGFLRGTLQRSGAFAVFGAIMASRFVLFTGVLLAAQLDSSPVAYFQSSILPGLPAMILQILILPFIANRWINAASSSPDHDVL